MAKYKISTWVSYVGWTEYKVSLTREQAADFMEYTSNDDLSKEELLALSEFEFFQRFKKWVEEADKEGLSLRDMVDDDLIKENQRTNPTDYGPMEVDIEP